MLDTYLTLPIRSIAVIGAGRAGIQLAARCCAAGYDTVLEDILPERLRHAARELEPLAGNESAAAGNLRCASSIEDAVRTADLVLDTVPDELESKLEIFSLLDRMAPPHTLFVTALASLSIADLASCTYRPGQCFGLRETPEGCLRVSHTPACAPELTAAMHECLSRLGYRVEMVVDCTPIA